MHLNAGEEGVAFFVRRQIQAQRPVEFMRRLRRVAGAAAHVAASGVMWPGATAVTAACSTEPSDR